MKGMVTLVVAMGVLIVAGVATVGITIARRLSNPAMAAAVLDEPAGTRMQSVSPAGNRLAVLLQGGGPDRVLLVDPQTGAVVGRVGLAR